MRRLSNIDRMQCLVSCNIQPPSDPHSGAYRHLAPLGAVSLDRHLAEPPLEPLPQRTQPRLLPRPLGRVRPPP